MTRYFARYTSEPLNVQSLCSTDSDNVSEIENLLNAGFEEISEDKYNSFYQGFSIKEPTSEPSEADDTAAMLVDHEYRLTLLELGLSE